MTFDGPRVIEVHCYPMPPQRKARQITHQHHGLGLYSPRINRIGVRGGLSRGPQYDMHRSVLCLHERERRHLHTLSSYDKSEDAESNMNIKHEHLVPFPSEPGRGNHTKRTSFSLSLFSRLEMLCLGSTFKGTVLPSCRLAKTGAPDAKLSASPRLSSSCITSPTGMSLSTISGTWGERRGVQKSA